jgi:hypothetical protein
VVGVAVDAAGDGEDGGDDEERRVTRARGNIGGADGGVWNG